MRERIAAKKRRIRHYLNDEETKQNEQRETWEKEKRKMWYEKTQSRDEPQKKMNANNTQLESCQLGEK